MEQMFPMERVPLAHSQPLKDKNEPDTPVRSEGLSERNSQVRLKRMLFWTCKGGGRNSSHTPLSLKQVILMWQSVYVICPLSVTFHLGTGERCAEGAPEKQLLLPFPASGDLHDPGIIPGSYSLRLSVLVNLITTISKYHNKAEQKVGIH